MSKEKQYVFSARTTPEGLAILAELRARLGVNWDGLLIPAVNAHYGVEVPMPTLVGPTPEERAAAKAQKEAEKAERAKASAEAKTARDAEKAAKAEAAKIKATAKSKAEKAKAKAKAAEDKAKKANAAKPAAVEFIPAGNIK